MRRLMREEAVGQTGLARIIKIKARDNNNLAVGTGAEPFHAHSDPESAGIVVHNKRQRPAEIDHPISCLNSLCPPLLLSAAGIFRAAPLLRIRLMAAGPGKRSQGVPPL